MRIIFVRHGHPDYKNDCLTELGHLQAEAAAKRLSEETIHKIYSSSCGRAVETAQHIAIGRGLDVTQCDFMREIRWGAIDESMEYGAGSPWTLVNGMIAENQSLASVNWQNEEPFCLNKVTQNAMPIAEGFDELLSELGYKRENNFYRVVKESKDNILMTSHAGSSTAVFAHIFNMPLPFAYASIRPNFTAITVVSFTGEEGRLISPQFEICNDARHIADINTENVFGN